MAPGMAPPSATAAADLPAAAPALQQRVVKLRRDYNAWVASETLEDYALRFTPHGFRRFGEWRVAHTAFGGAASFLVLEAVGATLLLQVGFVNAFLAVLAAGAIIFAIGLPISVHAARHGLDMDLLTRGAGFGYLGSTFTSLIYASFTFIFFALEAAVMAYALELAFGIPPAWGYLICAAVVVPLATHGITAIARMQAWTQPLWLLLLLLPYAAVFHHDPGLVQALRVHAGLDGGGGGFDPLRFGAALTVALALVTQMGEQADYLRFMPPRRAANRWRWWGAVLLGGPGWVLPGMAKMLGGMLLAVGVLQAGVAPERAVDPNRMYLAAYELLLPAGGWAVAATALFVIVSQLKINVTNAYAGSLAWSNFFARLTHSHPGRVVWMVFNIAIALLLMELEVFGVIGGVLALYANVAISWLAAVVADLVVNKPLGWSPRGVEFRRARLPDLDAVGLGATALASTLGVAAHLGAFGPVAQAWSALLAMGLAFVAAPAIALALRKRRLPALAQIAAGQAAGHAPDRADEGAPLATRLRQATQRCTICERDYEAPDVVHCPAYGDTICSLCCSLDARCHDLCKPPTARAAEQLRGALRALLPRRWGPRLDTGLAQYLGLMAVLVPALAALLGGLYLADAHDAATSPAAGAATAAALRGAYLKTFFALLVLLAVFGWWGVLAQVSRRVAQEESNRQTEALVREIHNHRRTDEQLQRARQAADAARELADAARAAAEAANQAKSRYISAVSHELRTPLNSILGYAQLLDEDPTLPPQRRQAVGVIRRGGEHLLSLVEGTLDLARIEAGKLALEPRAVALPQLLTQVAQMFELQAAHKGLRFEADIGPLPALVRADERRLAQILINLLGNAVKFTAEGGVTLRVRHRREMASFEINDTGPGIAPDELERVFEPFARGEGGGGGSGLGLTIARMLTQLMGGEMSVSSRTAAQAQAAGEPASRGTSFRIRLFLPVLAGEPAEAPRGARGGYAGPRRRVLVVDNEEVDRQLLARRLEGCGFEVCTAASGHAALALLHEMPVDAVLMDLAMPGIDGWETIRQIRRQGLSDAPVAVVSANAFDKGLDNDVGITPADFITKPLRFDELLDWLGRRLALSWTAPPLAPPEPPPAPADLVAPPAPALRALRDALQLGWPRGVQRELDALAAAHPQAAAWLAPLRSQAAAFQFDRALARVDAALHAAAAPGEAAP